MGDAAGATSCSGRYACCSEKASEKSLCSRQRAVYVMVVVAPARQEPLLRSCRPRPQPTPAASLETQQHLPASNAPVRQCLHILVQSRHIQHQRKGSGNVFHVSCVQEQCAYFWYWRSRALWVAMLLFKVHFYNPDLLRRFTFWGMLAARLVFLGMSAGQTPGLFTSIKTGRSSFVQCQDRPPPCQWPAVCKLPKSWTMEERAHLRQTWPAGRPAAGSRHPQRSPSARCAGEASGAQRRHLMMSGHAPSRHPAHESDAALEEQQNRPQGSRLADSFSLQVLQIITLSFSSPTSRRVESVLAAQEVRRQSGKGNGLHHSPVMRFTTVV